MKPFLSLIALVVILSCNNKSVIDQNIADYIKKNAHNPESYEAISLSPADTMTKLQRLRLDWLTDSAQIISKKESAEWNLKMYRDYSGDIYLETADRYSKELNQAIIHSKTLVSQMEEIAKHPAKDSIEGFTFIHQFRIRVPLGGIMLKNALVETDKDLNIISFVEL